MINKNLKGFLMKSRRNLIKINICIFFYLVLPLGLDSQIIIVKDIVGIANISGNISPYQARFDALTDAKIKSLQKAGVSENINSYQTLYTYENNNNYEEVFIDETQSQLRGNIKSFNIKNERIYCKNENEIVYEITINAEVIKYKSEIDNKFQVNIENLKTNFNVGDDFSFQFKSTVDCYLTIFDLLDTTAVLVYSQNEAAKKIIKNSEIKFPFDGDLHAELSQGNVATSEPHRLLLVFTKEAYPFILHNPNYFTSFEKVISWVNSIEPSQKNIQHYSFIISPK
jgi:hypothetical protein